MEPLLHYLYDYNFQANKTLIEKLKDLPEESADLDRIFSHILNAHHIWNRRILREKSSFGVWDIHSWEEWSEIHYDNQRDSFEILSRYESMEQRVEYQNSRGEDQVSTLDQILYHIINHSTQHRGQLLMKMRERGMDPLSLDLIYYKKITL
jgi:uncharacterized damage-inducible protein DinB